MKINIISGEKYEFIYDIVCLDGSLKTITRNIDVVKVVKIIQYALQYL